MDAAGRVRLDAVARFLQDAAIDDVQETGWGVPEHLWVVRADPGRRPRAAPARPRARDRDLVQRRRRDRRRAALVGRRRRGRPDRGRQRLDPPRPRPAARPDRRLRAVRRRRRRAGRSRRSCCCPTRPTTRRAAPWALRSTDLDAHGHVNNAVYWQAVEDVLTRDGGDRWRDRCGPSSTTATRSTSTTASSSPSFEARRRAALPRVRRRRQGQGRGRGRAARRLIGRVLRAERVDASFPGGVEVGAGREAVVELEHDHPVGERERGPGCVGVSLGRRDEGRGGAVLEAGREALAWQRAVHHQPVQVRVGERPAPVRGGDRGQRVVAAGGCSSRRRRPSRRVRPR